MKKIITIILILVILCGGGYCAYTFGLLDRFLGQKEELKIDKTANVVTSIKKISEFVSMNYYEEFLLSSDKESAIVNNSVGHVW